MKDVLETSWK